MLLLGTLVWQVLSVVCFVLFLGMLVWQMLSVVLRHAGLASVFCVVLGSGSRTR